MKSGPFKGKVRVFELSSLRKVMRAACCGKLPSERMGIIKRAAESAAARRAKYQNAHARMKAPRTVAKAA